MSRECVFVFSRIKASLKDGDHRSQQRNRGGGVKSTAAIQRFFRCPSQTNPNSDAGNMRLTRSLRAPSGSITFQKADHHRSDLGSNFGGPFLINLIAAHTLSSHALHHIHNGSTSPPRNTNKTSPSKSRLYRPNQLFLNNQSATKRHI